MLFLRRQPTCWTVIFGPLATHHPSRYTINWADWGIELRMPRQQMEGFTYLDLAESIGTYRETATQVLNDFKSAGLIEISRKRISILDRTGLASVDTA